MQRIVIPPRANWQDRVSELGLIWHTADGQPYWNESAYYQFTPAQIEMIETATNELYGMLIEAGDYIVRERLFHLFGIPSWVEPLIIDAWNVEPPALNYGRFDFGFDGINPPKMFEFNADTPTSLLEAAVIQWDWLEQVFPGSDQFNGIDDALVAKWRDIKPSLASKIVHFTHATEEAGEDAVTVAYMRDVARRAGLVSVQFPIDRVGWNGRDFVDYDGFPIRALYKLYPWEWLVAEEFGRNISHTQVQWIEPIWKMIWSNKAILPILWHLFPNHPNLLRSEFREPTGTDVAYAKKPILAREGANVSLYRSGQAIAETDGAYTGTCVYQELFDVPSFDGNRPVIGSWVVDGAAVGMGIREGGLITNNTARFVPHRIV